MGRASDDAGCHLQSSAGRLAGCPDFLFLRCERKGIAVDLLDPHALSMEDAPAKAAGLAHFAAEHGHRFGRIELIIVDDEKTKRLNLNDEPTRDKVKGVATNEHLRQLYHDG